MIQATLGSELQPDRTVCREHLAKLRSEAKARLDSAAQPPASDDSLCEAHNAYTLYTSLCLIELTGHRPVADPFCYRSAIAENFAVIEDKAVTERHATRLVVLCHTVREQIRHYGAHLRALLERLSANGVYEPVIPAIEALVYDPAATPKLPYLFLLTPEPKRRLTDSLSEGVMNERLGDLWPWPLNAGRHLTATELRNIGVSPALIDFQLGHLLPERQYAGPSSTGTIADAVRVLGPALEQIAGGFGFEALPGLTPQYRRPPKRRPRSAAASYIYVHGVFGPERRKAERFRKFIKDCRMVRDLCKQTLVNGVPDPERLNALAEQLTAFSATDPLRLEGQLRWLWKWAYKHRPAGSDVHLPLRRFTLLPPPSPFDRKVPTHYTRATRWRLAFAEYLERAALAKSPPTPAERIAEIVLSAALHGALVDEGHLRTLAATATTKPLRLGDTILITLPAEPHHSETRWVADALTAILVSRLNRGKECELGGITMALGALLKKLEPGAKIQNPWKAIAEQAGAWWQYYVPGFVRAKLAGKLITRALPLPTMVRLLGGARLALQSGSEAPEATDDTIPMHVGGKGRRDSGTDLLKAARKVFTAVSKTEARGHGRSHRNLKTALCQRLREVLEVSKPDTPAVAKLCVLWAIHLGESGTRTHGRLAFSTINRYFNAIAPPLIDAASEQSFLELDDGGYEVLYEQALLYPKGKEREYFAGRLLEFHAWLVDAWCVEEPDWSALPLPREQLAELHTVDANFLTPSEYQAAIKLLETDPIVDAATRLRTSALLVLGYRFGTRISDALRLRYGDMVLDPEHAMAILHVHSNIYGAPKSESGNRQIPLIGTMAPEEWRALTRLKDYFDEHVKSKDQGAGLFADPEHPRAPIERRRLLDRIHLAMRLVSGDPALRYHHLRHSFATRLGVALFADIGASAFWGTLRQAAWDTVPDARQTRLMLTGTADLTDDTIQALPCLLGHASAETSFQHYFHLMDGLVHGIANAHAPSLSARAWSYVTGANYDAVRKRLLRVKETDRTLAPAPIGTHWNGLIPEVSVPLARGHPPASLPGDTSRGTASTLETTDRVLLACASRGGNVAGIADRLLVTEAQVHSIVGTARRYEARAGTVRIEIGAPDDYLFSEMVPGTIPTAIAKETPRLRAGLRSWEEVIRQLRPPQRRMLCRALESWYASTVLPSDGAARFRTSRFNRTSQLAEVLEAFSMLGVSQDALKISAPASKSSPFANSEPIHGFNLEAKTEKTPRLTDAIELRVRPGSTPFGYSATLYRALYVALVHLSALDMN